MSVPMCACVHACVCMWGEFVKAPASKSSLILTPLSPIPPVFPFHPPKLSFRLSSLCPSLLIGAVTHFSSCLLPSSSTNSRERLLLLIVFSQPSSCTSQPSLIKTFFCLFFISVLVLMQTFLLHILVFYLLSPYLSHVVAILFSSHRSFFLNCSDMKHHHPTSSSWSHSLCVIWHDR